ncbi:MAG: DUF63 family protein [Candidatus Iainarchaeum archaeon]|uniref:DUF63 family protein n=1 Tax=Candidatus Iainarchaeum sp. TaxID=3101447 RepID=A0A7T9DJ84_9ARCH|nr:MAG: DUF63 family protein [Candidatus Diapherotrites archaeon]
MALDLNAFVYDNFIRPMIDPSVQGYNPVNTIVYGIILLGIAFYVIYPFLNKHGIKFDFAFLQMLLPYIVFGSSLRVLEDQQLLMRSANPLEFGFYLFTPGIWFLTFAFVAIGMLIAWFAQKKFNHRFHTIATLFGALVAAPLVLYNLLQFTEWIALLAIVALAGILSYAVFWIGKRQQWRFLENPLAKAAFFGQLLDASATFIALQFFSCGEQHFLPRLLFGAFGPVSFFFVKIPLMLLVLHYIHKEFMHDEKADKNLLGFILLFLAILGFATGMRDLLTVAVGTCN